VNNTEKPDDLRRRMRRIETRLAIIQRTCILQAEYTGRPRLVMITKQEQKILDGDDAGISGERGQEKRGPEA
jgi:hypothetical protein